MTRMNSSVVTSCIGASESTGAWVPSNCKNVSEGLIRVESLPQNCAQAKAINLNGNCARLSLRIAFFFLNENPFLRRGAHHHRLDVFDRDQRKKTFARMRIVSRSSSGIGTAQQNFAVRYQTN